MKFRTKNSLHIGFLAALCFVIPISLWFGLKPGQITYDSGAIIVKALNGQYHSYWSPTYQYLWGKLIEITLSPSPILAVTLATYWLAVFLFTASLLKYGVFFAYSVFFFALHPNVVGMTHIINTDTAVNAAILLFLSACLALTSLNPRYRFPLIITASVSLAFIVLLRYNSLVLLPPFSFLLVWSMSLAKLKGTVFFSVILAVALLILEFAIAHLTVVEKQDYVGNYTIPYDLISISIEQNHRGVTRSLNDTDRINVEEIYNSTGWYMNKFEGLSKLRDQNRGNRSLWVNTILYDPVSYLKVRIKTFNRMFTRQTRLEQLEPLFYWSSYENRKLVFPPLMREFARKGRDLNLLFREIGPLNLVQESYGGLLSQYFLMVRNSWWIPIFAILAWLYLAVDLTNRKAMPSSDSVWIFMALSGALLWYATVFVLIQIPMTRYVFPANAMVVMTFPVFIAAFINRRGIRALTANESVHP